METNHFIRQLRNWATIFSHTYVPSIMEKEEAEEEKEEEEEDQGYVARAKKNPILSGFAFVIQ